jgi:hypothetical protein
VSVHKTRMRKPEARIKPEARMQNGPSTFVIRPWSFVRISGFDIRISPT